MDHGFHLHRFNTVENMFSKLIAWQRAGQKTYRIKLLMNDRLIQDQALFFTLVGPMGTMYDWMCAWVRIFLGLESTK